MHPHHVFLLPESQYIPQMYLVHLLIYTYPKIQNPLYICICVYVYIYMETSIYVERERAPYWPFECLNALKTTSGAQTSSLDRGQHPALNLKPYTLNPKPPKLPKLSTGFAGAAAAEISSSAAGWGFFASGEDVELSCRPFCRYLS